MKIITMLEFRKIHLEIFLEISGIFLLEMLGTLIRRQLWFSDFYGVDDGCLHLPSLV